MGFFVARKIHLTCFVILFTLGVSTAIHARGNQYKHEVFAAYSASEDEQKTFENDQFQVGYSLFDLPVVYGDYPYLLTNFFERRTHLDLVYANSDTDSTSDDLSSDFYKINYSFANVGSPLLFNIGVGKYVGEGEDFVGDYDLDAEFYYFGFGYYVSPNAIARVELTSIDYELTDDVNPDVKYDETRLEATWRHIVKVDEDQYIGVLLAVEAIKIESYHNSEIGVLVDYFISKKVAFGLGIAAYRGDFEITEGDEVSLRASVFLDGQTGLVANISRLYADQAGSDEDSFFLKVIYRFN